MADLGKNGGPSGQRVAWAPLLLAVLAALMLIGCSPSNTATSPSSTVVVEGATDEAIANAFAEKQNDVQVTGAGVVTRVLSDDNDGSRHQRFILKLQSGQTLLIAHNIDIATRLDSLAPGDVVSFNGVYEWNSEGGTIHWTHHDPDGQHPGGWLQYNGKTFQ
ncbi:MAG: DUF3465 domain-containing protein [Actinomycetota bacterium]|jgi:ABC-type glycerol-3-phosphate transport system substrate-binding protein|nr:DUF3465 domain-containing protein [Actinomycetota bacterium]